MNAGIYQGAASLAACDRWQATTAQNIACASVSGYRKSESSFSSVLGETLKTGGSDLFGGKDVKNVMPQASDKISMQAGQLRSTGNELDFAVEGKGFFKIQRTDGSTGYTRDGEFHLSPDRTLVNKDNFQVVGEGGPITFRPEGGRVSINDEGTIVQGDTAVGKLPLFDLDAVAKLKRIGDGLLAPAEEGKAVPPMEQASILTGTVEGSNVQPLQEMVNLITVARAYESAQKIVQAHDEVTDKAIQSLGNPN